MRSSVSDEITIRVLPLQANRLSVENMSIRTAIPRPRQLEQILANDRHPASSEVRPNGRVFAPHCTSILFPPPPRCAALRPKFCLEVGQPASGSINIAPRLALPITDPNLRCRLRRYEGRRMCKPIHQTYNVRRPVVGKRLTRSVQLRKDLTVES